MENDGLRKHVFSVVILPCLQHFNCKFSFVIDGSLYTLSPIDPVFLAIPYLKKVAEKVCVRLKFHKLVTNFCYCILSLFTLFIIQIVTVSYQTLNQSNFRYL